VKKYRNILLFCFFIYSGYCQQTESSRPEIHEIVTERYPNGLKKLVHRYQGTGINEILIGKYGFYENGIKKSKGTYKDGKLDGPYTEWYDDGQKSIDGIYKDGIKDGLWIEWTQEGKKKSKTKWKNGKKKKW